MKSKDRLGLLVLGAFLIVYGAIEYHRRGVFPYLNWHHQPVFPVGLVIVGVFLSALAFLPSASWVDRRIRRIRQRHEPHVVQYLEEHRHKHRNS